MKDICIELPLKSLKVQEVLPEVIPDRMPNPNQKEARKVDGLFHVSAWPGYRDQ